MRFNQGDRVMTVDKEHIEQPDRSQDERDHALRDAVLQTG
jgi:hypothetical protein